jgi:Flp pilus assembly protein TadG
MTTVQTTGQRKPRERGSAMIELAVSVVLLLTIMTGVVEFGRMFYFAAEVANAARAGVQWGVVNPGHPNNFTAMQSAATDDAANATGLTATASETCECDDGSTVNCTTGTCATGAVRTYVKVVASAPFSTIGSYWWIPKPITMNAQATIRVD